MGTLENDPLGRDCKVLPSKSSSFRAGSEARLGKEVIFSVLSISSANAGKSESPPVSTPAYPPTSKYSNMLKPAKLFKDMDQLSESWTIFKAFNLAFDDTKI